jgi:opacity protein-like surface antigen
MIKKILLVVVAFLFTTQLMAEEMHEGMHQEESKYYAVIKGLYIVGDNTQHGEALLSGDDGYGFGIDLGYRLEYGFSLEYDFSYSTNSVTEVVEGEEPRSADASYMTHAIDLVYGYEVFEKVELFAKVGYEYEVEKISDYGIDNGSDGAVIGAGVEYEFMPSYKIMGEYEHSTIDGPRGNSLYLGLMYNF